MDAENLEVSQPKKRGAPRLLDLDPNMAYSDYRKINQKQSYESNPRRKADKKVLTKDEIRENNLEHARKYYIRNRDKIIMQIMGAKKRRKKSDLKMLQAIRFKKKSRSI